MRFDKIIEQIVQAERSDGPYVSVADRQFIHAYLYGALHLTRHSLERR